MTDRQVLSQPESEPLPKRLPLGTMLARGLRLRCPRCGEGRLFTGWFTMPKNCPHCQLQYERAPGYFLGSAYINYGLTALTLTGLYIGLHFGMGLSNSALAWPLGAYCVFFPLALFRHARALWLAMDCFFDTSDLEDRQ